MPEYVAILLRVVEACLSALTHLFNSFGGVPYYLAGIGFVLCCRYMILPLLDSGSFFTPDVRVPIPEYPTASRPSVSTGLVVVPGDNEINAR